MLKQQQGEFKEVQGSGYDPPVAFLKPLSTSRTPALIKGGWGAYVKNEEGYRAPEEGGVDPLQAAVANKVGFYRARDNLNLIEKYYTKLNPPGVGTPAYLLRDNRGGATTLPV